MNLDEPSKNSTIAKNGFRAETAFCIQEDIKKSLESYFNLPIKSIQRIHGKKSDIKILFDNEPPITTTIPNETPNK